MDFNDELDDWFTIEEELAAALKSGNQELVGEILEFIKEHSKEIKHFKEDPEKTFEEMFPDYFK